MLIYANPFFLSGHLPEARGWPLNEGPTVVAKTNSLDFKSIVLLKNREIHCGQYRLFFNISASMKIQKKVRTCLAISSASLQYI